MAGRVEVCCGPAGTGKTERLLAIFREAQRQSLQAGSPGLSAWITPTTRSRRAVRASLLDASLGVCFAPNVFTFDAFAERLLQTTGPGITPLVQVAQRMIARTVIDEAVAADSLPYFAAVADTTGFLDLLLGLIAELKRDETEPDDFEKACRKRKSPRDAELVRLYRRYQERLTELALYDSEGRFWEARIALEEQRRGAFESLSLVVVDGFADFTQPQYEILQHLAAYADRVLVSLPLERPLQRTDLFAKSVQALDEVRRRTPVEMVWLPEDETARGPHDVRRSEMPRSLRHIADHLFDNPRAIERIDDAKAIEIVAAAGPAGEGRVVAERVKRLLVEGTPPEQIVIASRSLEEDWPQLGPTLASAGIPTACETRTRFSQTAVGRMLFAVLQAELEDWEFEPLCAVLRSNLFRPRWNSSCDRAAVEATIRTLRRYQLGSDRKHILKRLAKLASAQDADGKREIPIDIKRDIEIAGRLLKALSDGTQRLRQPKELRGWTDAIVSLGAELGIEPPRRVRRNESPANENANERTVTNPDRLDERDRTQWQTLCDVLHEAARIREVLDDRREMTLGAFVRLSRDLLQSQALVERPSEQNCVRVLEAANVRNLDVPYLFLMGLSEASFPRGRRDDCFYSAFERREILRHGGSTAEPSSPQQDEMLLFYSIVTRARRRLVLSYPNVSPSGQPLFPSPYVGAIQDLFDRSELEPSPHSDLDPIPTRERILSPADLRLVATDELRTGRPELFRTLAQLPRQDEAARGILAAAEMDAFRFEEQGFTPFEGLLQNEATIKVLAGRYSSQYEFSATQLEGYATCPYRFLLKNVLKLEPFEMVEPAVDPRQRGRSLHQVLADLHRPAEKSASAVAIDRARLTQAIRELVAAEFSVSSELPPYERSLLEAELEFAGRFAELYVDQWESYAAAVGENWDEPPAPRFVELPFGAVRDDPHSRDAGSHLPYVSFGSPEAKVRVQGRIDRIDVGRRGGQEAFTVIDYKTRSGRRFDAREIEAGIALQLAIYLSAARRSGILNPDASPFQIVYWNLTLSGCVSALKGGARGGKLQTLAPDVVADIERTVHDVVPKIAGRIRAGQFPVINADPECAKYCAYRMTCRVGQVRSLAVERQKTWGLSQP